MWDDKKPKAVKEHVWTAILLSKERTKVMGFKRRTQWGCQWRRGKQREGKRLERKRQGRETGREKER